MALPEHSKIINKVARGIFKEYGIERKGQSRTWLDDQYWYTTIIEFQPFKDRQGTCLNVGINFHWYEQEYFSFDIGNRESDFIDFKSEKQFQSEMESLTEKALKLTIELRKKMADLKSAEQTIINHKFTSDNLWGNYHRAIICGLNNEPKKSDKYFNEILKNDFDAPWAKKLKDRILVLKTDLNNVAKFQNNIDRIIERTRKEKKLKEIEIKNVW
ncbi:hypothetical protein [Parvicella tangerina]|uniref:DUF4304 domain-containing protein n=1 Tax=Parvicella tangerina TaxID=2829795 RepID=A0A916NKI5_9FLAO|nr:hypothetical protein [Parvicella tangerina]CAG5087694.1 hypothetical protein CRYO30217_03551 [Parvicella tangerina]CAG5087697.1 hypothetical protein CRYO30217_03552 [Parvicella tangerina]